MKLEEESAYTCMYMVCMVCMLFPVLAHPLYMPEFNTRTRHGYVWCKNLALNIGERLVNWKHERTIEDDVNPGSDHPQCQHRKVGLAIMF